MSSTCSNSSICNVFLGFGVILTLFNPRRQYYRFIIARIGAVLFIEVALSLFNTFLCEDFAYISIIVNRINKLSSSCS